MCTYMHNVLFTPIVFSITLQPWFPFSMTKSSWVCLDRCSWCRLHACTLLVLQSCLIQFNLGAVEFICTLDVIMGTHTNGRLQMSIWIRENILSTHTIYCLVLLVCSQEIVSVRSHRCSNSWVSKLFQKICIIGEWLYNVLCTCILWLIHIITGIRDRHVEFYSRKATYSIWRWQMWLTQIFGHVLYVLINGHRNQANTPLRNSEEVWHKT